MFAFGSAVQLTCSSDKGRDVTRSTHFPPRPGHSTPHHVNTLAPTLLSTAGASLGFLSFAFYVLNNAGKGFDGAWREFWA